MAEIPDCYVTMFEQPLTIEPGKCYVLRANKPLDPITLRDTMKALERETGAKFVILDAGMEILTVKPAEPLVWSHGGKTLQVDERTKERIVELLGSQVVPVGIGTAKPEAKSPAYSVTTRA